MNRMYIAALVVMASAGAAQAGSSVSNLQFLQAARCRGLAVSEGLGKQDTVALDSLLRREGEHREAPVRVSANAKMTGAQKEGDKAQGDKKAKLLAERDGVCAVWLAGGAAAGA